MENIKDFNFDTKNGKEEGQAGRPSKEFLEQKEALEAIKALEKFLPGIGTHFLREFKRGSQNGSSKNIRGTLEDVAESPITKILGPTLLGGAGIVAAVFAIWQAEEHIEGYPPVLHILVDLLNAAATMIKGTEEFQDKFKKDAAAFAKDIQGAAEGDKQSIINIWKKTNPIVIVAEADLAAIKKIRSLF